MGRYSAEDTAVGGIALEIKGKWKCGLGLGHETCVNARNAHIQISRPRMRQWAGRIVSSLDSL